MNFYAWTGLINAVTTTVVAIFVASRCRRDPRRITFIVFSVGVAQWSAFYFLCFYRLWQPTTTAEAALLLYRTLLIGSFFIPVGFFHHVVWLVKPVQARWQPQLIWSGYAVATLLCLANSTPLVVESVKPRLFFPYWPSPGPLFKFYTVWFFGYVGYALWLMWRAYLQSVGPLRNQLRYLLVGDLVAFSGGSMNFFLWYDIPIPPIGNVVVPFYVILAALAAVRYQFLDIKVAVTRTGVLLATYLVVLGAPFALASWGRGWLEREIGAQWWLVPLGLCTVLATIGPFAYAFLRRQAEARLLKEQRRYQRALQHAARGMTRVRNVNKLANLVTRIVSRTVGVTHASLLLWNATRERYLLRASHGRKRLALQSRYELEASHPLIQWLKAHRKVISREELADTPRSPVSLELECLDAALVIPGLIEHNLIGFLALGPKLSGAGYSADDLHAFSMLANEAAVAIENAISYEELLKVNQQLKAASERLVFQERLAAAGQFATGMAHEIKNPLSAIKTFAQYLPEKYADPAFRQKFFRIVQSEIDRINEIVRELSDFAKPAPLQMQSVPLGGLVEETLALLSTQCLKQKVEVRRSFGENGLAILADPSQIKQVLLNLFLNSLEAMADGGGRLEVETRVQPPHVTLRIKDTGSGIAPDHQRHVWDPFFTTKERGMGLGLAIVKGVVERHGGQISLSSAPGQGTTVQVSLPLAARSEQ